MFVLYYFLKFSRLNMVAHACNAITQKIKAGKQQGEACLSYTVRPHTPTPEMKSFSMNNSDLPKQILNNF